VSHLSILVLSDGPHEIGHTGDSAATGDGLPPLSMLVSRILGTPSHVQFKTGALRKAGRAHKGEGHARKASLAIADARKEGHDAVVILLDADGDKVGRRAALERGRTDVPSTQSLPCAVGVAVETFDAWMIADGSAIGKAGGNASISHPSPESLGDKEGTGNHPKDRAGEIFGDKKALGPKYKVVAAHVDTDLLEKCCPKGFGPFAQEIRERIGAVIQAS
jgi:hypothetical protein